jgi:hypothetical protein
MRNWIERTGLYDLLPQAGTCFTALVWRFDTNISQMTIDARNASARDWL